MLAACLVAYVIVFGFIPLPAHYQVAVLFSILLLILIFNAYALYRAWRGVDYTQELTAIVLAWTTLFSVLIFLSVITKTSASFSRAWLILWFGMGGVSVVLTRYAMRRTLQRLRAKGYNLRHIVILASGSVGKHVFDSLTASPEAGFSISGYFSDDASIETRSGNTRHGELAEAVAFIRSQQIDQIWLAMPLREADKIGRIMEDLKDTSIDVRFVPDIFGFRLINHSISTIAGMAVINLSVTPMDGVNRWLKAAEDKCVALLLLLAISPLFLLIALGVKLSSPGPVFYRQTRVSWNGNEFLMYKFRTMPENAEQSTGAVWSTHGEIRATGFGSLLRRTSLDELPQFWNVLKGDMSIVGPRPERPEFVARFKDEIPSYMQKHKVKAGITGWAQVNGWRGDTGLRERIEHDLYYIDNWSIWLDIRIMFLTVFRGFVHKNAH